MIINFVCLLTVLSLLQKRGKSGQRRAPHHLTDGFMSSHETDSATETRLSHIRVIKVKTCGKSARWYPATAIMGKPCGLQCHVNRSSERSRVARPV